MSEVTSVPKHNQRIHPENCTHLAILLLKQLCYLVGTVLFMSLHWATRSTSGYLHMCQKCSYWVVCSQEYFVLVVIHHFSTLPEHSIHFFVFTHSHKHICAFKHCHTFILQWMRHIATLPQHLACRPALRPELQPRPSLPFNRRLLKN